MATYLVQDDEGRMVVLNTEKARAKWTEETDWDGSNNISRATGSQWEHETLYQSAKGRYYLVRESQWQGVEPVARFVSDEKVAAWLLLMEHEVPAALREVAETVEE
jgi:hypothetical protein